MNTMLNVNLGRFIFILTLIWIPVTFIAADDSAVINDKKVVLDIDTAVSRAMANNLGLESEKLKYESKKWSMITSWNTFIPSISISGTLAKSNKSEEERKTPTSFNFTTFQQNYTTISDWSAMGNFKLSSNINAAMGFSVYQTVLDWQSGKISLESAKQKLALDVKKAVYNLILMQNRIDLLEKNLETAKRRYDQSVINYRNGLASEYMMLSAQVGYENLKPMLLELKNGYNTAMLSFKQMIGIKKAVEVELNASLISEKRQINTDELINKHLNSNLNLQALNMAIRSLENVRNISIAGLTPTFSIMYTMDPMMLDPLNKATDWTDSDNWKQNSGALSFSLSLNLDPFVPFSKTQMDIVRSQLSIKDNKLTLQNTRQGLEMQVESIAMTLQKSIESIDSLKLNIKLAEKAYQQAEDAYNAGNKEILEVKSAEDELNKAKLNLLVEEFNYTTNLLDLENVLNTTL